MIKKYAVLLPVMLSSQFALADIPASKKELIAEIEKKTHQELLMASHLTSKLVKSFDAKAPLSYAKGHEFYDTPVVLVDEEGKTIDHKYQYKPEKNYHLVTQGATIKTESLIWFFSPYGTNPEEISWNSCVAENPCQKLTQPIVEFAYAHQSWSDFNKYWLASGTYDLPVASQQKNKPKLIELHLGDSISGRSSDFIHNAYDNERPLVIGTLAWSDYSNHYGASAEVNNIRMKTIDNQAQIADFEAMGVNIYAGSFLTLTNSELYYENTQNPSFQNGNIYAGGSVSMENSTLNLRGMGNSNIEAGAHVMITNSILNAEGSGLHNITNHAKAYNMAVIDHSTLSLKLTTAFYDLSSSALTTGAGFVSLASSTIDIQSVRGNPNSNFTTPVFAIEHLAYDSQSAFIDIVDSNIKVMTEENPTSAIATNASYLTFNNSKVTVSSTQDSAEAVTIIPNAAFPRTISFVNEQSAISVSSPVLARLFAHNDVPLKIVNRSTPASQCAINKGESEAC